MNASHLRVWGVLYVQPFLTFHGEMLWTCGSMIHVECRLHAVKKWGLDLGSVAHLDFLRIAKRPALLMHRIFHESSVAWQRISPIISGYILCFCFGIVFHLLPECLVFIPPDYVGKSVCLVHATCFVIKLFRLAWHPTPVSPNLIPLLPLEKNEQLSGSILFSAGNFRNVELIVRTRAEARGRSTFLGQKKVWKPQAGRVFEIYGRRLSWCSERWRIYCVVDDCGKKLKKWRGRKIRNVVSDF